MPRKRTGTTIVCPSCKTTKYLRPCFSHQVFCSVKCAVDDPSFGESVSKGMQQYWAARHGLLLYEEERLAAASSPQDPGVTLLSRISKLVPKGIIREMRDDIIQTACLLFLDDGGCYDHLPDIIKRSMTKTFREFSKFGPISLDAPPPWDEFGRPLLDTIGTLDEE